MTIALGTEVYNVDAKPVIARGRTLSDAEVKAAVKGPVAAVAHDVAGDDAVAALLSGIAETGFEMDSVKRILSHPRVPEDWRVGEAIAECQLRDHRGCTFPWPSGRDQRNPDSSQAGADLVGFQKTSRQDKPHRFTFGEVKTSEEAESPPNVTYGRHGLIGQLEALRDDHNVKDHLVKYLCHRVAGQSWKQAYIEAAQRFLANDTDISLFGVLIRDVPSNSMDLKNRAKQLAKGCPAATSIELAALYLPLNRISKLGKEVSDARN